MGSGGFQFYVAVNDIVSVNELTEETEIRGFACGGKIIELTFEYKDNFNTSKVCNGKGVIYYMKDENGCEAPYDFKNITFDGHFTFDGSSHCKIEPAYEYGIQILNNIVFDFSDDSAYVTIGANCKNLLLKDLSGDITIHSGVQGESAENPTELTLTGNLDVYNKNGEIVIVDKSSDDSSNAIKDLESKYNNLVILLNKTLGVGFNEDFNSDFVKNIRL